ncbi:MAG: sulfatase [Myxococcales bacterium]|nr:sulfatase [Myxococcales bacterium]
MTPQLLWLLLVCLCIPSGCGRGDAAPTAMRLPASVAQGPAEPVGRLPGDRLAYRFVDHAGEARLELGGTSLSASWAAFRYPYKLPSPYSGLRGESALRAVEVALADADVAGFGLSVPSKPTVPVRMPRFDPVWNRYRAVYQSRSSLFAPAPSRYRFSVRLPTRGVLTMAVAAVPIPGAPGTVPIEFSVQVDGRQVYQRVVGPDGSAGRWHEAEVDLGTLSAPRTAEVSFITRPLGAGPPVGVAVWGNPLLWARDSGTPGPNFLFVVIDTLRADALAAMPYLSAYAHRGVRFSQAITAATWTRPSILSMLGGDMPTRIGQGAEALIPPDAERRRFYALGPTLLPRILRSAGWRTTAIGNNFFLLGYPQIGLDLGFEEVADVRHPVLDSPAITRAALDFLRRNSRRPFFLHLHYDAPHWPYTPPPAYLQRIPASLTQKLSGRPGRPPDPLARAYLAEAAYADDQLRPVLEELDRLGLSERTVVVVVGDHGEVFDPAHSHFVVALGLPTMYHHGWAAYDELLRVPLIISMPGRLPQGREVSDQVRLPDIAPTVLDLLGLPVDALPGGRSQRGRSLVPLALGQREAEERVAFVEGQNVKAVRAGGFAYLRRPDGRLQRAEGDRGAGPIVSVTEELYDLRNDPLQHVNLATSADPVIQEQLQRMRALFERELPRPPSRQLPVLHLRVARHGNQVHRVTGTLTTAGANLAVRSISGGELRPDAPNRVLLELESGGAVDLQLDPEARIELQLAIDGTPLPPERLLIGPYALPLLAGRPREGQRHVAVIDGALLSRLDAQHPPVLGDRGEVLLWRDEGAATPLAATAQEGRPGGDESEIATMMRSWGYAQPEKKK